MSEAGKMLFEYKYATRKSIFITSAIFFGGGGLFFIGLSWQEKQVIPGVAGLLSLICGFLGFQGTRGNKRIKVYEDRIEIPFGPLSKKNHSVNLNEIQSAAEITAGNVLTIQITIENKKNVYISSSQMVEEDFYKLLEYLESIPKKKIERSSPIEESIRIGKAKFYKWFGLLLPTTLLIVGRLISGELKTADDWKSVALISSVIFGINFFLEKARSSKSQERGDAKKVLSRIEAKKIKQKWELAIYLPAILGLATSIFLLDLTHEGITSIWPFISYGIAASFLILFFLNLILPDAEGAITKGEKYLACCLSGTLLSFVLVFGFVCMNITLDKTPSVQKTSYFTGAFPGKSYQGESCFRIAHWVTGEKISAGDAAYCNSDYPSIQEKDQLSFLLHDGFLGVPWISDVKILKFKNIESFMSKMGSDLKLRYADVAYMAKLHGNTIWQPYLEVWNRDCKGSEPSKCRLASYALEIAGKREESITLLKIGCSHKDFLSCYNYFVYPEFSKTDLMLAKQNMSNQCKDTDDANKKDICKFVKEFEVK